MEVFTFGICHIYLLAPYKFSGAMMQRHQALASLIVAGTFTSMPSNSFVITI